MFAVWNFSMDFAMLSWRTTTAIYQQTNNSSGFIEFYLGGVGNVVKCLRPIFQLNEMDFWHVAKENCYW